jgi:spore coat-associated protein N
MQRFAAVWHASPRKLAGALAVLLLSAGMAVGSGASFTAQSASPGNLVTAGALTVDNNKKNAGGQSAIFSATNMKPGDTTVGTVQVSNTGNVAGDFSLALSNVVNTPGPNGGNLSGRLSLHVEDITVPATPSTVYNGLVSAYGGAKALTTGWAGGAARTYRFTVTWATPNASDNNYQGSQLQMDFDWSAVQS